MTRILKLHRQGYRISAIAEACGVSEGEVQSALAVERRKRERLRKMLVDPDEQELAEIEQRKREVRGNRHANLD